MHPSNFNRPENPPSPNECETYSQLKGATRGRHKNCDCMLEAVKFVRPFAVGIRFRLPVGYCPQPMNQLQFYLSMVADGIVTNSPSNHTSPLVTVSAIIEL